MVNGCSECRTTTGQAPVTSVPTLRGAKSTSIDQNCSPNLPGLLMVRIGSPLPYQLALIKSTPSVSCHLGLTCNRLSPIGRFAQGLSLTASFTFRESFNVLILSSRSLFSSKDLCECENLRTGQFKPPLPVASKERFVEDGREGGIGGKTGTPITFPPSSGLGVPAQRSSAPTRTGDLTPWPLALSALPPTRGVRKMLQSPQPFASKANAQNKVPTRKLTDKVEPTRLVQNK